MHIHPEIRRQALMLRAMLAASFLTAAPPVFCDTQVLLTGPVTLSGISGFAGTPFTLGKPEDARGVYGLWSAEGDGKPCQIAAMKEDINDYPRIRTRSRIYAKKKRPAAGSARHLEI
jgi:hypothetical protein